MNEFGTMTLHRDLAIKLAEGLKLIPEFKYIGKVNLTDDEVDSMKEMSPKEMATWWGNKHDLKPKNKILLVFQEIFRRNQDGKQNYPASQRLSELELDSKLFFFLFRIGATPLFSIIGERSGTKYIWKKPNTPPIFSDAEDFYNTYLDLKKYRLNAKQRLLVDRNSEKDIEAQLQILNITDEKEIEFARFRLLEIKGRQANRERKEGREEPKKDHIITSCETRTILNQMNGLMKQEIDQEDVQESKQEIDLEILIPTNGEKYESKNGKGELFILNERLKLYKAINKNLEKHNKKLKKHNKILTDKIIELSK